MTKTARTILFLLLAVLASTGFCAAQQPSEDFGELIEVTEVFLDVLATDRKGRVVSGLGVDDFVVTEDGQPVEITSLAFYTTRYAGAPDEGKEKVKAQVGAPAGESAPEIPSSRYFILFFHDQKTNSSPGNRLLRQQLDAGRKAHNWVRDELSGSDWVAVVSYDVKLIVHQDFTQDQGSLLGAIGNAALGKHTDPPPPSRRERIEAGAAPSLWRDLPDAADLSKETRTMYDAIRLIAEASRTTVGRKNLLLFSIGFGELEADINARVRPDKRYYPAMEQALNDSNVAVYTIDLTHHEFDHLQSDFLNQLANDSGGYYYRKVINFQTPLQRIAAENIGYYLLSFRTEHPSGESGYREIRVKSKNNKVRVRTRRGYRYGIGG